MESLPWWVHGLTVIATILVVGKGALWIVEGAVRISKHLGISELVVGLTVVAFGTSAPEFAVTLLAAFSDQGDISVGNIVGSNIFNLGFILGGCAAVRAIPITPTLLWRDGAFLAGGTILLSLQIGLGLRLTRGEATLLLFLLLVYLIYLFQKRSMGPEGVAVPSELALRTRSRSIPGEVKVLVLGLVCVVGGSHLLVDSASALAGAFGMSEWVIGVTIVAAGTSAPEFATSLVGVLRGRYALSAGNLIGSDIFNLFGVLGVAGMLRPLEVDPAARISLAALSAMVFMVLVMMRIGWRISRLEGLLLATVALVRWGGDFWAQAP